MNANVFMIMFSCRDALCCPFDNANEENGEKKKKNAHAECCGNQSYAVRENAMGGVNGFLFPSWVVPWCYVNCGSRS